MNQLGGENGEMCFRYNVRPDGKADTLTLHGACPVLFGTKWGESIFLLLGFLFLSAFFSCQQVDPLVLIWVFSVANK